MRKPRRRHTHRLSANVQTREGSCVLNPYMDGYSVESVKRANIRNMCEYATLDGDASPIERVIDFGCVCFIIRTGCDTPEIHDESIRLQATDGDSVCSFCYTFRRSSCRLYRNVSAVLTLHVILPSFRVSSLEHRRNVFGT